MILCFHLTFLSFTVLHIIIQQSSNEDISSWSMQVIGVPSWVSVFFVECIIATIGMYVCMYLCIYASMYVCMYLCIYVCMYVCMFYICMYVCMFYICMYVCMYLAGIIAASRWKPIESNLIKQ